MKAKSKSLAIADLRLDGENPRLPETSKPDSQPKLANYIANEYNTLDVARSISEHGYFDGEPLIAVKTGARHVVVEGNRRLTALKLLTDDAFRSGLELDEQEEWDRLAADNDLGDDVDVVVAANRAEVDPIIGYRHIAGIEPWDPWAKARFIARQIEGEGKSFADAARVVGESESRVRANYRNYRIVKSADRLHVPTKAAKSRFGFFTRAMNSVGLREHIERRRPRM